MSDERVWNYRRGPSLLHKIRAFSKSGGEIYEFGITIPKQIAWNFLHCKFVINQSGDSIILQSGCDAFAKQQRMFQNLQVIGEANGMKQPTKMISSPGIKILQNFNDMYGAENSVDLQNQGFAYLPIH